MGALLSVGSFATAQACSLKDFFPSFADDTNIHPGPSGAFPGFFLLTEGGGVGVNGDPDSQFSFFFQSPF